MTKLVSGGVYKLSDGREVRLLEQPSELSVRLIQHQSDGVVNHVVGSAFDISLCEFSALRPTLLYTLYNASVDSQQ